MPTFHIDPDHSSVAIDARSSVHPILSKARGLDGWVELALLPDGGVDLTTPVRAHVEFAVKNLSSGNPLEERELKRRIDARRYPTITGDLTSLRAAGTKGRYVVGGDLTFRGVTNSYEDELAVAMIDEATVELEGAATFDVRDFGMEPPRILMLKVEPLVAVRLDVVARRDS